MVSIGELETDVKCNSAALDPIVERAISMNVRYCNTHGSKPPATNLTNPLPSISWNSQSATRRHTSYAGTRRHWELGIRAIRDTRNVYAEIAGSDPVSGFVEMAVRELGAERVIYGSDVGGEASRRKWLKSSGPRFPIPRRN